MGLSEASDHAEKPAELSGKWVVIGMFIFAIAATAGLFAYWELHTAPFRELQDALAQEFPRSRPRVEGGQRKKHKHTPRILRIVLRVEFDPTTDEAAAQDFAHRVAAVARRHHDISNYDTLEIHLYETEPEQQIREKIIEIDPSMLPD